MMHLLLLGVMLLDVNRVSRPEGVKIAYDVRGAGDTTLVFIHDWGSERGAWRQQADYFAARHQVVTLDLASQGQSTAGRRKLWTVAGLADDVCAVVAKLKAQNVILVGHGLGGSVALLAAAKLPVMKAVILVDTLHNADVPVNIESGTGKALMSDYAKLDQPAMLRAVKVPIRAINSTATATNLAVNRKYADFDATVLQDSGHLLMLEKPGEFNAILREWLSVLK